MRIIGGKFRGKTLSSPSDDSIRPTSDRARESIFNILGSRLGPVLAGKRVLDLFAGTGALGCEALSRGAKFALFVDEGAEARGLIRANIEALSLTGVTKIFRRDASKMGEIGALAPFDLVFCDPPYGKGLAEKSIASARAGGWFAAGTLIVVEEAVKAAFQTPEGFQEMERRQYGDSEIILLRLAPAE
jgi:16S rRNA (guanine966-N2)-methyltransferase